MLEGFALVYIDRFILKSLRIMKAQNQIPPKRTKITLQDKFKQLEEICKPPPHFDKVIMKKLEQRLNEKVDDFTFYLNKKGYGIFSN